MCIASASGCSGAHCRAALLAAGRECSRHPRTARRNAPTQGFAGPIRIAAQAQGLAQCVQRPRIPRGREGQGAGLGQGSVQRDQAVGGQGLGGAAGGAATSTTAPSSTSSPLMWRMRQLQCGSYSVLLGLQTRVLL